MTFEKSCINCGILRSGYTENEICECPDKNECIEELRAELEKAEQVLKTLMEMYDLPQMLGNSLPRQYFEEKEKSDGKV